MAGGAERHSSNLKALSPEELPAPIREGVDELREAFPSRAIRCLFWNERYVAVAMDVPVDLPSRGPVDDIDIRPVEPVLLLFHKTRFPRNPPLVYSDRKDFPIARLPHLIPTSKSDLARLCLHRGSFDDWFAEHSLVDLVDRVRGWLRDAASNRLIREEDRFEGTRIEDAVGIVVYPASEIIAAVEERWQQSGGSSGACFLMATLLRDEGTEQYYGRRISYRINFPFPDRPIGKIIDLFGKYNRVVGEAPREDRLLFGLLVWTPQIVCSEYFGSLPSSYGELKVFCQRLGIDLADAVEEYRSTGAQLLGGVPLVLAVLRPQRLIGMDSAVELLHVVVLASDEHCDEDGWWKDTAPVLRLGHRTPLTAAFAREMSREGPSPPSAFALVGCGAVGSKLSLHLVRAGHVRQTLIDESDLSPHHLVRHGLGSEYVGKNKAEALKEHITSIYRFDQPSLAIRAHPGSIFDVLETPKVLEGVAHLIDATASSAVLSGLVLDGSLPETLHYSRCEIADAGRLGLVFWEGPKRNPRLDDLQALLFSLGQQSLAICRWLGRHRRERNEERAAALDEIDIGVSCNSTTLRLADDVVSFHASVFAAALKQRDAWASDGIGRIQISLLSTEGATNIQTETILIPPVLVLPANGSSDWQVRMQVQVGKKVSGWMRRAGKNETGGLLLGLAHRKRKIIYVTDVLPPSKDSEGTPYAFKRGVKDYPRKLDEIAARTGGLIGYVGEWHTHPDGAARLSPTDRRAVGAIRRHLDAAGIPTHIMIFGKNEIVPYVFAPDT